MPDAKLPARNVGAVPDLLWQQSAFTRQRLHHASKLLCDARVTGLELCYSFTATALVPPVIDRIALQRGARSAGVPVPTTLSTLAVDDTGRVDSACTTVSFAPVTLLPTDLVGVGLRIDYPDAPTQVLVGAGSLILRS